MKIIFEGTAKSKGTQVFNTISEDMLLNPALANQQLSKVNLKVERVEEVNGEKIVYISESKSNILLG